MTDETVDLLRGWAEKYNDACYFQEDPIIFPKRFVSMLN